MNEIVDRITSVICKAHEYGLDRQPLKLEIHMRPETFKRIEQNELKRVLFTPDMLSLDHATSTLCGIPIVCCNYMSEDFRVVSVVNEPRQSRYESVVFPRVLRHEPRKEAT